MSAPRSEGAEPGEPAERIVELEDERSPLAGRALALIRSAFPPRERQPIEQIAMEVAEKRLDLLTTYDFHLFAVLSPVDEVMAVSSGVYLGGVNAGLITYLAVDERYRGRRLGSRVRAAVVEAFRGDARQHEWAELAAVLGEIRLESPWLRKLVRDGLVIPFDLTYYHPGMDPSAASTRWVLYRQPVADERASLPVREVRQLLYAIWRRAYRVRWPLERDGFHRMLEELEGRSEVGAHPEVIAEEEG